MVIINCGEDGPSIEVITREDFLERLEGMEDYYGTTHFVTEEELNHEGADAMNYVSGLIVIDGDVVIPKPVETVTKFEL